MTETILQIVLIITLSIHLGLDVIKLIELIKAKLK